MKLVVYAILLFVILASIYFFVKIIKDGKKNLLKTMLKNNDITYDTYMKYLERLWECPL